MPKVLQKCPRCDSDAIKKGKDAKKWQRFMCKNFHCSQRYFNERVLKIQPV